MGISHAIWFLSMRCNYRCPYCENWQQPRKDGYAEHTADDWISFFQRDRNFRNAHLDVTGGEPLAFPGFANLMASIPQRFSLTSNISLPIEKLEPIIALKNFVGITCSYHPTQTDLQTFLAKLQMIKRYTGNVSVNFVSYLDNLEIMPEAHDAITGAGVRFHVDPYRGPLFAPDAAQEALIGRYADPADSRPICISEPPDKLCDAGQSFCCIRPCGTIYPCVAKSMYGPANPLGNCFTGYKLYERQTYCSIPCSAGCDRDHTRRKPFEPRFFGECNVDAFLEWKLNSAGNDWLRWKRNEQPWDHMRARYAEEWAQDRFHAVVREMAINMEYIRGKRCLDFACGHEPWYGEIMATAAARVLAADITQPNVLNAILETRRCDWNEPGCNLGDEVFDFILFSEGIEHVGPYRRVIADLLARCRGLALFTFPIAETPGNCDPDHRNFFRPEHIPDLFGERIAYQSQHGGSAFVAVRGSAK